jgi:ribonuclease BN (tRNA processing enzyme)
MRLTVIGSSDAFNAEGRGCSCYVVESPGAGKLMIDFGPTALFGLRRAGISPNELAGVVFTHLHGDHAAGFPLFVIDALYNSLRTTELSVLGPALTREVLDALLTAMYGDVKADVARLRLLYDEFLPGETRQVAGYEIRAFEADHMKPPHRPLCLRVTDAAGKSVAFSGDTRLCPGLFEAAEGAELLVAECTRLAPPAGHHCTFEEWREALPRVRARSVLFSHLGADVRARAAELASEQSGPVRFAFADDGLAVTL